MNQGRRFFFANAAGALIFVTLQKLAEVWLPLKQTVFATPAGRLAAQFLGAPCQDTAAGLRILHDTIDVSVVADCSGFTFFALLAGALVGLAVWHRVRSPVILMSLLPAAYLVTLAGNAARIVCAVHARSFRDWIPLSPDLVHFALGTAIFVTLLTVSCHTARSLYEHHLRRARH